MRAQYTEGWVGGEHVPGYREEPGVSPTSMTETFVALGLRVDNWRWADVPVLIRTASACPAAHEVVIHFQPAPHVPFEPGTDTRADAERAGACGSSPTTGSRCCSAPRCRAEASMCVSVSMEFLYGRSVRQRGRRTPTNGCSSTRSSATRRCSSAATRSMESWRILAPVQQAWAADDVPLAFYPAGSWQPEEAERLLSSRRRWSER